MDIRIFKRSKKRPKSLCEEPNTFCLERSLKLKRELRKKFDTPGKSKIREFLFNKTILPRRSCEEPIKSCISILDFYGGGLNVDYIIKRVNQAGYVKNHGTFVKIYSIESNKQLWPAMIEHAKRVNQGQGVKNQNRFVKMIPFCGSLANFVHTQNVKNQISFDSIWLDYCDMGKGLEKDLRAIRPLVSQKTLLAISIFLDRCSKPNIITRQAYTDNVIAKTLPKLNQLKQIVYSEGDSSSRHGMINLFFKQRYNKLSKEVSYYEAQASN